jgi:cytochrome c-type biogenesis protein CcmH
VAAAGALVAVALVVAATRGSPGPATVDEQVQRIAAGMRCVACENLSVADSPSDMARAMRDEIRRRLEGGQTPDEIKAYFVGRYGQWILLSPPASGISIIPWAAPPLALLFGGIAALWVVRRRRGARVSAEGGPSAAERARIRQELALLEEPE